MQILGKRNKVLLIVIAIVMLLALGVSFAMWDNMSTVKATTGNVAYSIAQVGDVIQYGRYYQTGEIGDDGEYEKTPIEWIVVDKDERTGQLTLMSKYILASGSYFGNWYNSTTSVGHLYNPNRIEVDRIPYNQAYVESTVRAYLNNLERRDLGGDSYESLQFKTSTVASNATTGELRTSVGFSNKKYFINGADYQRPIKNKEYRNRPATRGFYDEAFNYIEKAMIEPKSIAGFTGFRWPTNMHETSAKTYVEGTIDKVWLPSATELNIMNAEDYYTNPSDESSSTVFEYFKDKTDATLNEALKANRTLFVANNSKAMNYSIPVYKYQSTEINDDIHTTLNSGDYYWTRSPMSNYFSGVRYVSSSGTFNNSDTYNSYVGVRPCIILKY